jgi:SAM-dependent methyltransferase
LAEAVRRPRFGATAACPPWACRAARPDNPLIDEIAKYWDEQAAAFDDAPDHGLRDPATRSAWRSLLLGVLPAPPARIADVGCGTGTLAVLLGEAGYGVSGIDLAPGMVRRARAKAVAAGVDADFRVADAMAPPWPNHTFDVVLARHVVWALPDPARGLDRWIDLLKPEGRLVLVEGRWWTGQGRTAQEMLELVQRRNRDVAVRPLDEPVYWGGSVSDERYLLVSSPSNRA